MSDGAGQREATAGEVSAEQASLRAYVKQRWPSMSNGEVQLGRCPVCGSLDWLCTQTNAPFNVVIVDQMDTHGCRPCFYVVNRHPELFDWVNAVVQHQIRRAIAEQGEAP